MSTTHTPSPASRCRNCAAVLPTEPPAAYCPACGQETALHAPTLREFVHEFVGHYVALEGNLWRTLAALVLRPGRLTREYLAGRRRRYVLPLRLYLTASFVFFLLVKVLGAGAGLQLQVAYGMDAQGRALDAPPAEVVDQVGQRMAACGQPGACSWLERRAWQVADTAVHRGAAETQRRLASITPCAIFALLPWFAALLAWAYRRRGMTYGEHFVFGLHMHSFWFVSLLAGSLVASLPVQILLVLMVMLYGLWAMHRVYGGRWWATAVRAAAIAAGYLFGLCLALALAVLIAAGAG